MTPPTPTDPRWLAVQQRNPVFDGTFVFAVVTTGIYCRPSCRSRAPLMNNVRLFDHADAAQAAGFRACKRCRPDAPVSADSGIVLALGVVGLLEAAHAAGHPPPILADLGTRLHVSPFHLQRTFRRVMGITPRQYAASLRAGALRTALRDPARADATITTALLDAGYGSAGALYDQASAELGMTPTAYRRGGRGQTLHAASTPCALGWVGVAASERGIAAVVLAADADGIMARLREEFPHATLMADADETGLLGEALAALVRHLAGDTDARQLDLPLDVQGTAFQRRVWAALQAIPYGQTRTYTQVAAAIGQPTAVRAVARACATNPAALAVPCHRVIREDGTLGGYKWGLERKRDLLAAERERGGG